MILLPFADRPFHAETHDAVREFEFARVDVSGSDEAYWALLRGHWGSAGDLLIVEHDIVPSRELLAEMLACPSSWCAAPYPFEDFILFGLGCVKFGDRLRRAYPNLWDEVAMLSDEQHPRKHWCRLDMWSQRLLTARGFTPHLHLYRPIRHLSEQRSHAACRPVKDGSRSSGLSPGRSSAQMLDMPDAWPSRSGVTRAGADRAQDTANLADLYDADYWENFGGIPGNSYLNEVRWRPEWARIAERIIEEFAPSTVLDVGCATGYLVEALRERGVAAEGIDFSEYALAHVRPGARAHVRRADVTQEPIGKHYDLITCIETLEHVPEADAGRTVANLAAYADSVLFSASADDHSEPTHLNVRAPAYWVALFARCGMECDAGFDGAWLTPQTLRFHRNGLDTTRDAVVS